MEFDFSKLQETATSLAQKAADGVQYVARKGKQTYERLTLENELGKAQRQLGAYYYNQVRMSAEHESAMSECIAQIDSILEKLNALEGDEVDFAAEDETQQPVCPACGATLEEGAIFCSRCGAKQ